MRRAAILQRQCILYLTQAVRCRVRRLDIVLREPIPGRKTHVIHDCRLKEGNDVLLCDQQRAKTWRVKGAKAGRVFAVFVHPEVVVLHSLVDPVFEHEGEDVVLACGYEGVDPRA